MSSRAPALVALAAAVVAGGCFDERPAELVDPAAERVIPEGPTDPTWPPARSIPPAFDLPPWLTLPGPAGAVAVGWQSVAPSTGWVEVVASPDGRLAVDWSAARRVDSDGADLLHHVTLTDLAPATAYRYRVHVDDGGAGGVRDGVFVTPGARRWRFVHLAEFHAPTDVDQVDRFADSITRFRPHVVVESGDMVDDGGKLAHWRAYLRTSAPWISNVFLLPTHSNHVNGSGGNPLLRSLFELPDNERWYTTRYGEVEFVVLDSAYTINPDTATQPAWIRERLAASLAADGAPTRVVASWHYPACSSSYAGRTAERRWVHDHFLPAFRELGALDLVLVGHDKYYERSLVDDGDRSIVHVMTNAGRLAPGTPGANEPECTPIVTDTEGRSVGRYDVDADVIRAEVVDGEGAVVDAFAIGE